MSRIRIREGFKDQIRYVIPRHVLPRFSEHPLVQPLMPTDIGWYPEARFHYCERENGAQEHILILCVGGYGCYDVNGVRGTLQEHQAVLIPRNTAHVYWASDDSPWSIYWVHFTGSSADFFAHQLTSGEPSLDVDADAMSTLQHLFMECCNALMTGFVLERMIYASQTLHHLLACLFFNNRAFSPRLQTSRFHNLDSTLAYLHQNVHKPLTLADMARHADLSPSHFSRLFKEQTSYSPFDYFIHLKIQHACRLLFLTRMTVREIGYEVGYEDPAYFSRLFKKVVGISPLQYRNKPRGDITERYEFIPLTHD
jgi:AraC family transcriptional regulator, arabinose operon regulatory protein